MIKQLLQKAKDSALLAIEYYNKPAVSFKSEGFIVMMCIAWTSLFHAYFLKNKIKPWYLKKDRGKRPRFLYIVEKFPNGSKIKDKKWWDLNKCILEFFKFNPDLPVQKNIEFLSGLRNLIVHRNLPELDASVFSECQANVLNFNDYIEKFFGQKHKIDIFLSFSLQLFKCPKNFLEASERELRRKNAQQIVDYIKAFRSSLSTEVLETPQYSFKAVLIQVRNHESKEALALRFVNEKDLTEDQKESLKNIGIVLIKEKEKKIDGIPDRYTLTYKDLINKIKTENSSIKINKNFHSVKNQVLKSNPELKYSRILDPKNPNSPKKDYYDARIIEKILSIYNNYKK